MKKCSVKNCENPNKNELGELPETEFFKDRNKPDGLRSNCKYCSSKYRKTYYEKHGERLREYSRKHSKGIIPYFKKVATRATGRCDKTINYKEVICLFVSFNGLCPVTNTKLNMKNIHLDHIKSVVTGGTNEYDNLMFVKHVVNMGKNGFGLNKYLYEMGFTKEQKDLIWKRIDDSHNRYEFMLDRFLEMTDEELTSEVEKLTKPDNIKIIDLLIT